MPPPPCVLSCSRRAFRICGRECKSKEISQKESQDGVCSRPVLVLRRPFCRVCVCLLGSGNAGNKQGRSCAIAGPKILVGWLPAACHFITAKAGALQVADKRRQRHRIHRGHGKTGTSQIPSCLDQAAISFYIPKCPGTYHTDHVLYNSLRHPYVPTCPSPAYIPDLGSMMMQCT